MKLERNKKNADSILTPNRIRKIAAVAYTSAYKQTCRHKSDFIICSTL